VGTGERESGRGRGQQLVVRGLLRSPTGKLDVLSEAVSAESLWRQAQDFIRKLEGR
jgi:hypothetical protein